MSRGVMLAGNVASMRTAPHSFGQRPSATTAKRAIVPETNSGICDRSLRASAPRAARAFFWMQRVWGV
jgi:hypothetical protein